MADQTTLEPLFVEQFDAGYGCNDNFRNDLEIRFTATGSTAYDWFSGNPVTVPYEVWNTVTNTQVGSWIADFWGDGEWTQTDTDYVILTNYDYDGGNFHPEVLEEYLTWMLALDVQAAPTAGDILRINGPRLMSPDDQFVFSSHKIVGSEASRDIDKIRVVPNPYLGEASWETSEGQRKLQFVNLPDQCSIRIYTLAGELIRTLDHANGTGTEDWNMLSESNRGIASGVYLYNVQSDYGNYTGKFAVIK